MIRYCPDCSAELPFEQFHADPGSCPDVPDGDCPEWGCTACGCALIVGIAAATTAAAVAGTAEDVLSAQKSRAA